MVEIVLFLVQGALWSVLTLAYGYLWREMKSRYPQRFQEMGAPESLVTDFTVHRIWTSYRYLLRGGHRTLPEKSLRVAGDLVVVIGPLWLITLTALVVVASWGRGSGAWVQRRGGVPGGGDVRSALPDVPGERGSGRAMQVTVLAVTELVSGAVFGLSILTWSSIMRRVHPDELRRLGGPGDPVTDLSWLRLWRVYRFLLRGGHRRLREPGLRIVGEIVLVSAPLWIAATVALLLAW